MEGSKIIADNVINMLPITYHTAGNFREVAIFALLAI